MTAGDTRSGVGLPPPPPPAGGKRVTLVLCSGRQGVLGALEPFTVDMPVWQEVADVVAVARARFGIDVVVLRLLRARSDRPPFGGDVVYLAEVDDRHTAHQPKLRPLASLGLRGDPLAAADHRAPYAEPGGPAAELAWADDRLAAVGREPSGPPVQVRTWNLSSLWRIPTAEGPVWLKSVPAFFAHEGPLLARLAGLDTPTGPSAVAPVLAAEPGRMLLAHVDGDDQYHARGPATAGFLPPLIELQTLTRSRLDELAALGVPDHRRLDLAAAASELAARVGPELAPDDRGAVERLLAGLPDGLAALDGCGLPPALVHGDFHPGNVRLAGVGSRPVVLDWADASLGSPARDLAHLLAHLEPADRPAALDRAVRCWQAAVPGCDPARAAALAGPVAVLGSALAWQGFLDRIEADERVYHEGDPAVGLALAAHLAAG